MYTLDRAGRMSPLLEATERATRRQDLPAVQVLNGAIYVARGMCCAASTLSFVKVLS
jgi:CMP-N-acetylneuraminic acid synthetase